MVRSLRLTAGRTTLAALLTVVAVALPSGTWLIVGGRQVEREAALEVDRVYTKAYKMGVKLASHLSARLAVLREQEARRPFYHYEAVYHDPHGASGTATVALSPLAQGPSHPYVLSYFQVDEQGRLSLPRHRDRAGGLGWEDDGEAFATLRQQLADVATFCIRGYDPSTACPAGATPAAVGEGHAERGERSLQLYVEELEASAWRRHRRASSRNGDQRPARPAHAGNGHPGGEEPKVLIVIGDLDWYTLPVGGEPNLVALRSVDTPDGTWTQGFAISRQAIGDYLRDAYYPARFLPIDPAREKRPGEIVVPVEGTAWGISLDLSSALDEVASKAAVDRRRFLQTVLFITLTAALAGVMVVALVYQSERLAAQRAQFAASAAHELRTPLAGLRLYSEMLAEGLGDPSRARQYASRLAGESERLGRVVTNVLSFTRLERRMLTVDPRPGDLGAAVREVVARNRPALEEAGAAIDLQLPDEPVTARFDRDALGHVLQNLLDNAEKYTREAADRTIRVAVEARPETAVLRVADRGPGIPPALERKLFRPFARGESQGGPEGLGLGLVLVRALVTAQGGDIRYAGAAGGGAVFTVTLPR
ncbi:MAG: sensor histidine kinase [Acidobacteria bacterium]|nr:MAG: sensor histidine kinase [Acidobacteriota bacterium]